MKYLGDLIQFTGGLVSSIDTASFIIGAVVGLACFFAFALLTDV